MRRSWSRDWSASNRVLCGEIPHACLLRGIPYDPPTACGTCQVLGPREAPGLAREPGAQCPFGGYRLRTCRWRLYRLVLCTSMLAGCSPDQPRPVEIPKLRADSQLRMAWSSTPRGGTPMDLAVSPDGRRILTIGADGGVICTEAASGNRFWEAHTDGVSTVQFSTDSSFAFAVAVDRLTAWDVGSGSPLLGFRLQDMTFGQLWTDEQGRCVYKWGPYPIGWKSDSFAPPPVQGLQHFRIFPGR